MEQKNSLPHSTAALVLGIISIPTCFCYGVVGIVCGIIAIVQANKAILKFNQNPESYNISSLGNAKAGKICGIIGLSLSVIYLIYAIIVIVIYGAALATTLSNFPK
jgi:hypothetical protein